MPRTTVENVVESIRRQLTSTYRFEVMSLGAAASVTDETLTLASDITANLRPGSMIAIGSEVMRVTAIAPGPREISVIRGWSTSTAEPHAFGDEVWVNPRFTSLDILDAMYDEIASWDPDLFRVEDAVFPVQHNHEVLELPAGWSNAIGVIGVRRNWDQDPSAAWPEVRFRVQRGTQLPIAASSGIALRLIDRVHAGQLHVSVAVPFDLDELTLDANIVSDVGLDVSMIDLLKLGVKYRLVGDNEAGATARTAQDEPRRAEETPPGSAAQEATRLYAMYIRRKNTEIMKLRGRYPMVRA